MRIVDTVIDGRPIVLESSGIEESWTEGHVMIRPDPPDIIPSPGPRTALACWITYRLARPITRINRVFVAHNIERVVVLVLWVREDLAISICIVFEDFAVIHAKPCQLDLLSLQN